MNCLESQEALQQRLDGGPPADAMGLKEHLVDCPSCRQLHQAAQVLLEKSPALSSVTAGPALRRRIVASILADQQARFKWKRQVAATLALAASLLLAVVAGYFWIALFNSPSPNEGREREPQAEAPKPGPSLGKSVEDAGQAVTLLTERLADQGKVLMSVANPMEFNAGVPLPVLGAVEQPLEPAAQSLRQAGQGVSEGLQTVTQSAQRAVSYFFREISPMDIGKQKSGG